MCGGSCWDRDYFPHTWEGDGVQLFFVSESLEEKVPHSHRRDANTHTHLPFRQNMAPHLFPHLSTRNERRSLSLLFLFRPSQSSSFSPSFPLSPSPFFLYSARSKCSHTDARIPTHTLLSPVTSLAISLPLSLSLPPHTHALSGSQPASTLQETALRPPDTLLPPSLSLCISECLSTTLTITPSSLRPISVKRQKPIAI